MTPPPGQTTIVHLDLDAFYVSVEREIRPCLRDRPLAVSQYNPYGNLSDCGTRDENRILYDAKKPNSKSHPNINGSLIAVSYEARARNVQRNDRGLEAIRKCPDLAIVQVPVLYGKACLSIYRDASERVLAALHECMKQAAVDLYDELSGENVTGPFRTMQMPLEKSSIDEVYLDLSRPVQQLLELCAKKNCWDALYQVLTKGESASAHTTIAGLETRQAAIATNSLSKDDIRRGSSLQVLDSEGAAGSEDEAGMAWWGRKFPDAWGEEEIALALGALISLKARQSIVKEFDGIYTLSAGVSTNKTMAKLSSGLKKPNRQTLLNPSDEATLQKLFHPLPLGRIRGLGGKLGCQIEEVLQVRTVGELRKVPLARLEDKLGKKQAQFLFRIAQGICDEEVTERMKPKCVGAGKTFEGVLSINSSDHTKLKTWLGNLASDIHDRIHADKTRYPKTLVCWLNMARQGGDKKDRSRASLSAPVQPNASIEKLTTIAFRLAMDIIKNARVRKEEILFIVGISVTATMGSVAQGSNSILSAFQRGTTSVSSLSPQRAKASNGLKELNSRLQATRSAPNQKRALQGIETSWKRTSFLSKTQSHSPIDEGSRVAPANPAPPKHNKVAGDSLPISSDLEHARALQKLYDKELKDHVAACAPEISEQERPPNGRGNDTDDADLEYAKQLQASFDRENEVITNMEKKKRSISSSKSSVLVKREGNRKRQKGGQQASGGTGRPISSFFNNSDGPK